MKEKIIVVGLEKDVISLLFELSDKYELIGYTDKFKKDSSIPYLGTDEEFINSRNGPCGVVIPIDSSKLKRKLKNLYGRSNFFFPTIVSKNAKINNLNISEIEGVIIQDGVYISPDVVISSFVKLNVGSKIFHDSTIGEYTTLAPGATILGSCQVGYDCFLGSNCTVKNGLKIDNKITIGIGTVVTKSLSNKIYNIFIGNPATPLIKE